MAREKRYTSIVAWDPLPGRKRNVFIDESSDDQEIQHKRGRFQVISNSATSDFDLTAETADEQSR